MKRLHITRRQMMVGTARAAAGLAVTCSCAPLAEQGQAKAPAGFKLGVCDWTIRKTADTGSFKVAKRIGLDGVQVDFGRGDNRLPLFDEELQDNMLKEARKRIRELEAALADAHIDHCLEHAFLEIACERMATDLDDFKKKNALTLSDVRKMRNRL